MEITTCLPHISNDTNMETLQEEAASQNAAELILVK